MEFTLKNLGLHRIFNGSKKQWKESFWNFNQEGICGVDFCREGRGRERRARTLCNCPSEDQQKKSKMKTSIIYSLLTVMMNVRSTEMSESQQWSVPFKMEQRKIIVIQNMSCYIREWWIKKEMLLN